MEYKRYVQRNKNCLDFPNCDDEEMFAIVFDVSSLEEEELTIELEGNKLKVSFKHGLRSSGDLNFSRDSTYVYVLPEHVQSTNLVAHWSRDNYLLIKEEKNVAITEVTKSKKDLRKKESKFVETLNYFSPTANKSEKTKQETISNKSRKREEDETKERKLENLVKEQDENLNIETKSIISAESKEMLATDMESKCAQSQIGKTMMQRGKSANLSIEKMENLMLGSKSTIVSNENMEILMLENKSTIVSNENVKNLMLENKSTILSNENMKNLQLENKSTILSNENMKNLQLENKSTIVTSESMQSLLQENESTNVSNESKMAQEEEFSSASSKGKNIINEERESPNESKVSIEKIIQKDKSMNASNTVLTKSRLIPKRLPHRFDLMISVGDLQAVMNDIEKKIKFVNEYIEKNCFKSSK